MMWLMLQQDKPEDFVIATGKQISVREFINICANELGWGGSSNPKQPIIWEGEGVNEIGKRSDTLETVIRIDPRYFRPAEVNSLLGDATLAKEKLGWQPKTSLEQLVKEMISFDKAEASSEAHLRKEGLFKSNFKNL